MKKFVIVMGAILAVIVAAGVALGAYVWITGGSGEASEPISAPTIAVAVPTVSPTASPTLSVADEATPVPPAAEVAAPTAAPTLSVADEATPVPPVAEVAGPTATLYRIASEESEVRFLIGEFLDDVANQVIGTTDQVAGDILIDFDNPAASQLGQIRVNVRTLRTDSGNRDRAIRSFVLESGQEQYEFAEFDPVELVGLPDSIAVGDTLDFQIVGNLTVKGIAAAVTFEAEVTVGADGISGTATGSVRYDAYGLFIPNARGRVTQVDEVVVLEIDFVAPVVAG